MNARERRRGEEVREVYAGWMPVLLVSIREARQIWNLRPVAIARINELREILKEEEALFSYLRCSNTCFR